MRGQLRHAAGLTPYSLHVRAGMAAQEKAKNPFARPDMSRAGKRLYRTKGRSEGNQ